MRRARPGQQPARRPGRASTCGSGTSCRTTRDAVELTLVSPDGDQGFPGHGRPPTVRYKRRRRPVSRRDGGDDRRDHGRQPDQPRLPQPRRRGRRHDRRPRARSSTPTSTRRSTRPASRSATTCRSRGRRSTSAPRRRSDRRSAPSTPRSPTPAASTTTTSYGATGLRRHPSLVVAAHRDAVEVWSDQPGLQVYTGNFLDGTRRSTSGGRYRQGDGIALEPQLFPDSPNHPEWPSALLQPGQTYRSTIEWRFGADASR